MGKKRNSSRRVIEQARKKTKRRPKTGDYEEIEAAEANDIRSEVSFLVLTATKIETKELHRKLTAFPGRSSCLTVNNGSYTYYVGTLGEYVVAHVQCEMGSVSPGSSLSAAIAGIEFWQPKAVLMIGIAFGVNKKSQNVGDVLVSKSIISYDVRREGKLELVRRGLVPPSGATLLDRFQNQLDWKHVDSNGKRARIIPCQMLSGEALIDNKAFRDSLLKEFKSAKGGEMEGAGLFAAAHEKGKEWIVIKGICDFADGQKSHQKARKQAIAARSSASLCHHVLSKKSAFESLGCHSVSKVFNNPTIVDCELVLFDVFKQGCVPYYLKRKSDDVVNSILRKSSLWISGPSGCGKTNSARFPLITKNLPFHFIDLSRCIGASVNQIFSAIHIEIAQKLGVDSASGLDRIDLIISATADLFRSSNRRNLMFMIDEIPISEASEFKQFVEMMCGLMIYLRNDGHNHKFVLASVDDPVPGLRSIHKKVHEQMSFFTIPLWTPQEINALLQLLLPALPFRYNETEKAVIAKAADGNPRTLKKILRNALMFQGNKDWPLERLTEEFC